MIDTDQYYANRASEYNEIYYSDENEQTYISYQCTECGQGFESVYEDDNEGICPHCGHDNWEE